MPFVHPFSFFWGRLFWMVLGEVLAAVLGRFGRGLGEVWGGGMFGRCLGRCLVYVWKVFVGMLRGF